MANVTRPIREMLSQLS